jgi:3-deoxy-manno-octulosonate cytidylyltransferase (CMP-KDO synthetase)
LRDPERRYRFIVNLQGDLPTVTPLDVQRCLGGLVNETIDISTIAAPITEEADVANPNIVKAIAPLTDEREVAFARDFQRLPGPELGPRYWHHIGIYAYRRESLERFVKLPQSAREIERRLEQMRALDNGMSIAVVRVDSVPLGVDTPADLEAARQMLKAGRF